MKSPLLLQNALRKYLSSPRCNLNDGERAAVEVAIEALNAIDLLVIRDEYQASRLADAQLAAYRNQSALALDKLHIAVHKASQFEDKI